MRSWYRRRPWRSASCARSERSSTPTSRIGCPVPTSCRSGSPRCSPRSTSCSTRATWAAGRTSPRAATSASTRSGSAGCVARMLPEEPEVLALLALMRLHESRRATRFDASGALVLLRDQDRSRWDHAAIAEAGALLEQARRLGRPGVLLAAGRHRRLPRGGADIRGHRLGRRSSRSTARSCGSTRARWCA